MKLSMSVGLGPVNATDPFFQVFQSWVDAVALGHFSLGAAHYLELVDVVDVDAELLHPLGRVDDRGVDPQGAAADQTVGQSLEPTSCRDPYDLGPQTGLNRRVRDIAEALGKTDAGLIQRSGVGEHPHQSGVFRIDIGEHDDRLRTELGGNSRILGPGPDREVEEHDVHVGGQQALARTDRDFVLPDDLVVRDDFELQLFQTGDQVLPKLPVDRSQGLFKEVRPSPKSRTPTLILEL